MEWGIYLSKGPFSANDPSVIYHICDKALFHSQMDSKAIYFPPTFQQDGFIHATREPACLLTVGNHFYKSSPGDWVCLEIDPAYLGCRCIYETPAPVGEIESHVKGDAATSPHFPHIYGGLPRLAIVRTFDVIRGEQGEFLSIKGLC
ncbi:DUF952 domain-containing protein [archaeon]|nr:MAG: DUF952 domain-containing protein [archaeon]